MIPHPCSPIPYRGNYNSKTGSPIRPPLRFAIVLIDLFRWFLKFLPLFALGLPLAYWAYRELDSERRWRMALRVLLMAAIPCALLFLANGYPDSTRYIWSAGRLVPTVAWMKGYKLYSFLNEGPVFVQMYGPVSAILYLPAALAQSPTAQMLIAVVINSLVYFVPGILFLLAHRNRQARIFCTAAIVLFILVSSRVFVLNITATLVTIDAPAIGMATLAFAALAKTQATRPIRDGLMCGSLIALAAWTKWTIAPAVGAMMIYSLLLLPIRRAMVFIGSMALAGLVISGLFILWFTPAVLLQTIVVPSRQPWQWPLLTRPRAYLRAIEWIGHDSMPVGWILLGVILLQIRRPRLDWPHIRAWTAENPWLMPCMAAVLVLPTSALAYVKIGGIFNNSAMCVYFALLAAASALLSGCGRSVTHGDSIPMRARFARIAMAILLAANCVVDSEDMKDVRRTLPGLLSLHDNDHELLYRYALKYPGEVYIPDFPLSTLDAEGVLYHFGAGLDSLSWAGFAVSDENLIAGMPPNLKAIVFSKGAPQPNMLPRMREFNQRVDIPELPGWAAMTRDGKLP